MNHETNSPKSKFKSTPPTTRRVRNPFDKALIERLHKPICSPSMYQILKKPKNGLFHWDIDQACVLAPRDIEACTSQFEASPDPVLDKMAEEVSERFFSQEMVIPSPVLPSPYAAKTLAYTTSSHIKCTTIVKEESIMNQAHTSSVVASGTGEIEKEHDIYEDYEITANGSLRRKLMFEVHTDIHYESDRTDDESHSEVRPPSTCEHHEPVVFSPDLNQDVVSKGQERTFSTPLKQPATDANGKCYRNKILDLQEPCSTPTQAWPPSRASSETPSSLASTSISPVVTNGENNQFTSPESGDISIEFVSDSDSDIKSKDVYRTCEGSGLRDVVLSPVKLTKKCSFSEKPLTRSRSVQKLDFSMDMSIDMTLPNAKVEGETTSEFEEVSNTWSLAASTETHDFALETFQSIAAKTTPPHCNNFRIHDILADTPVKGKTITKSSHEISKIRTDSPINMSLDSSIDSHNLSLEHKNIDFNSIDLKVLTESTQSFANNTNLVGNNTKIGCSSTSLRKVDSGFNEFTFYTNASSYYSSAIKPSELTITNTKASETAGSALKEISNVNWMRTDSGFKDENSVDSVHYYQPTEKSAKKFRYSENPVADKENVCQNFDSFFLQPNRNEAMSMSEIFTDEMTFNCNFSSTPSKCKSRKLNS